MLICPKCKKQLKDGTVFCDECGTKFYDTVFCTNCGKRTSTEFKFCQQCGALIEEKPKKAKTSVISKVTKKFSKISKKWLIIFAGGILGVALLIVLACFLFGGKTDKYTMYIKDGEIFFSNLSKDDSIQVTTRFFDSSLASSSYYASYYAAYFCTLSNDGQFLFFPDKIDSLSTSISLYYINVNKPDADPVKISSNVTSYYVNDKATVVTYQKETNGDIYQYSMKKDDSEKIGSEVTNYAVSEDGKKVIYLNTEGSLYVYLAGKDKEKLDSNVSSISYVSEDLDNIYYIKEGSLYNKTKDEEKEKISSNVSDVLAVYESGEVYFLKSEDGESSLLDYVLDDKKDSDASLTMPTEPTAPSILDYSSVDEYNAAYIQYQEDYTDYTNKLDAYQGKLDRDLLREALSNRTLAQANSQLCFYNGKETLNVADKYAGLKAIASESAVIVFNVYNQASFEKVNLSEIVNINDVEALVTAAMYSASEIYIAVGDESTLIEQTGAKSFSINEEGTTVYYIDDIPQDKEYGELYQIKISKGNVKDAELYDSEVSTKYSCFVSEDKFMYFKDVDSNKSQGELYINKDKIDYDVYIYRASYIEDSKQVVYIKDWDSSKSIGTLKVHEKGKSKKISDDVYDYEFGENGEIFYLYDYSLTYSKGDLYSYKKGDTNKIDTDVSSIIYIYRDN